MPGRGQYWKKGGLVDETVKEEDLSQALQTKVNAVGGGGGAELVGSDDVTTPKTDLTATISPTISLGSIQELDIVAWFSLAVGGSVKIQLSGLTTADYRDVGRTFTGAELGSFGEGTIDGWTTGLSYDATQAGYIRIQVAGQQFGNRGPTAIIHAYKSGTTSQISYGGGDIDNTELTNFSEVKILATQNFTAGSSLRVYKVNRT